MKTTTEQSDTSISGITHGAENANGAGAPDMRGTEAAAPIATGPDAGPVKERTKNYKISPRTHPLPKRVENMIVRYLKAKARAGQAFAEVSELLMSIMAETQPARRAATGASREKVIVPGLVYAFSQLHAIDGKLKGSVQIVDNFAQPEVTKVCRVSRWDVKTWKGDGPAAERPERAAANAEAKQDEDALP